MNNPNTPKLRKVKILSVLSNLHAEEALPQLTQLLETTDLQKETINALSGTGADSIPLLIDLFQTSTQSSIQAEAAKALGNIAAKTGDPRSIPPLAKYVSSILPQLKSSEDIDFPSSQKWSGLSENYDGDPPSAPLQNYRKKFG